MTHRRVTGALVVAVVALALPSCGGDGGGDQPSGKSKGAGGPTSAEAQRAQNRLDGVMTQTFNRAQAISAKPYACLRRAPSGGPALAACESTCRVCSTSMKTLERQIKATYTRSPRYVRTIYRPAYMSEVTNLRDHAAALSALGDYARVHGASTAAGMAEFDRAKALIKTEDASGKRYLRLAKKARARFRLYLRKLD